MRPEFKKAVAALLRLIAMQLVEGTEESPAQDFIRDEMDDLYGTLEEGERLHLGTLSAMLNYFEDAQNHMRGCLKL